MEYVTLHNGVRMPQLGFGVYQTPPEETQRCVSDALEIGYRHIDTAQAYNNEEGVGAAVKTSGIDRQDIFLTSKVWFYKEGYTAARASIDESLKRLDTDYIDLMLVHQPFGDYYSTYRALEEAYEAGKLRAIGVSNFYPDRLVDLCEFTHITPMVNQVETHVFFQQQEARPFMDQLGIIHESWGPFAEGINDFFTNPTLSGIAEKYGKTVAQVALRYLIERGVVVIPKSTHKERMAENFNVFDFQLSDADKETIALLDTHHSVFLDHRTGETAQRFAGFAR
ncbi:aldo/keto reductase [Alloscardovia omnicolens]|uniref:aldo/keto reductase n=1 Tax=Alloscardovia omnicolens TaxID=419015 RepID=UPI003A6546EE